MSDFRIYKIFVLVIALALILPACGPSDAQESVISTAVAQTVQAGQSPTATATSLPTNTPGIETTVTPAGTPTGSATVAAAPADPNCAKASLISESPPDKTIMRPGEYFWKTWTLQNVGTCTWTTAYKLVFWNGELLGGLVSYALPDDVAPNEQINISIYLQAPTTEGTFAGYWRLQTPWETNFGVGQYDEDVYVQVVVSDAKKLKYSVTSVTYKYVRNPPIGCPTNVRHTIYATITVDGPAELDYRWLQSDGNESGIKSYDFTEAGSITVSREWMVGKGDSPNTRWMQIVVLEPKYQEFPKMEFENVCP